MRFRSLCPVKLAVPVLFSLIPGCATFAWGQIVSPAAALGGDKIPAGITSATIKPGKLSLFILDFTFDASVVSQIFQYSTEDNVPAFAGINYNAASKVSSTRIVIQIRFLAADDAPGGTYPVQIVFRFYDFFGSQLVSETRKFDLIVDAPPPPDDHGDMCETATMVSVPSATGGHLTSNDIDFFRVELDVAGTLTAFSTGQVNTRGTLLGGDCVALLMDDDGGAGSNFRLSQGPLDAGTYYLSVQGAESADIGDYALALEFEAYDPFVHFLYFPQVVNGTDFISRLQLLAKEDDTQVRFSILGDDGNPVDVSFGVPEGEVSIPTGDNPETRLVPADGLGVFETDGFGAIMAGSLTVVSDHPLDGSLVFGGRFGLAGVDPAEALSGPIRLPVQRVLSKEYNTGIALQNLEDHPITLSVQMLDKEGTLMATADSPNIPGFGHRALFVDDFNWNTAVDFENLDAILQVTSSNGERFAAVALLSRPGQLASLPVTPRPASN